MTVREPCRSAAGTVQRSTRHCSQRGLPPNGDSNREGVLNGGAIALFFRCLAGGQCP